MPTTITDVVARDIRFPTSRALDGSDAMNPDPDYSAAYVVLRTSTDSCGYGLVFTVGRGNDLQAAAPASRRRNGARAGSGATRRPKTTGALTANSAKA